MLFVAVHDSHPLNLRASPPNCNQKMIIRTLNFKMKKQDQKLNNIFEIE